MTINRTELEEIKNLLQQSLNNVEYTDEQEKDILATIVDFAASYTLPSGEDPNEWNGGDVWAYHIAQISKKSGLDSLKLARDAFTNREILHFILYGIKPDEETLELYKQIIP